MQAILIALGVISSVLIHFGVVRGMFSSKWLEESSHRIAVLALVFVLIIAHVVEIAVYAVLFMIGVEVWELGTLTGAFKSTAGDYFYFSAITYTTVGFGDVTPDGRLRLLTSVEALNGIVLIGWSTSATFLAMQRAFKRT
jgi:hypothetical protein